jgi:tetratricopeptide (TPR) repeat protein
LETALDMFNKQGYQQGAGVAWAYRALGALLMGEAKTALEGSSRARELADVYSFERDIIRAEWLLGAAHRARGELAQAETHLAEALRRCRRINLIETEPNILLELARLRHAQGRAEALSLAQEALDIADRCGYRLVQADCHNFLAELALALSEVEGLEAGDTQKAQEHAEIARERAWCDGPPHRYEAAFQEAERLLERLGVSDER